MLFHLHSSLYLKFLRLNYGYNSTIRACIKCTKTVQPYRKQTQNKLIVQINGKIQSRSDSSVLIVIFKSVFSKPPCSEQSEGTWERSLWPSNCRSSAVPCWMCRHTESPSHSAGPPESQRPGLPEEKTDMKKTCLNYSLLLIAHITKSKATLPSVLIIHVAFISHSPLH